MRLSEYTDPRAVPRRSTAISPGKHCPLTGVGFALNAIKGLTLIYVGTRDCVRFAQREAIMKQKDGGVEGARIIGAALDDSDIVFGIRPQLEKLLEAEAAREGTEIVAVVTSCAVEVMSEDLESVAETVRKRTGVRVILIPIENFKTFSYLTVLSQVLEVMTGELTELPTRKKTFAILGSRYPGAEHSMPVRFLLEEGWELFGTLPFEMSAEKLRLLSSVELCLVTDGTALAMARGMESRFGIPYVRFDRRLDLDALCEAWVRLGKLVGRDMRGYAACERSSIAALERRAAREVRGKTFVYSQNMLSPFETCLFLAKLGMEPLCMFLGSAMDRDDCYRLELGKLCDPLLLQNADASAMDEVLREMKPHYLAGGRPSRLRGHVMAHIRFETSPMLMGFEGYRSALMNVLRGADERSYLDESL